MTRILLSLTENFVLNELKVDIVVQQGKPWWE